ncbi:complement component 1, r subcomponent [Pangasianodon hypophthalmus]|uniref:complement component 1, r subcomponent n=1 Tax=Pangasianodon hypophthalmus TaxID=310915 RepID=UPI000EFFDE53|nr:complement component 1, r subcomponent [Pangasianodon hypophthalmus]
MARLQLILSVLCVCVSVCVCKRVMYGQVQSPLYPKPYPADVHQQWDLEVPHGYQLQITFNYLDIEPSFNCYYDSLTVLHGKKVLGKFCGPNSTDSYHPGNKPILSPSNRLQLVFVTDESNTEKHQYLGFSAFYQAVDIDECSSPDLDDSESRCSQICLNTLGSYLCACYHGYQLSADQRTCVLECAGGVFTEPEGFLSSPGFPNAAPLGVNCLYSVSVQPGFQVTLNFSDNFHIEQIDAQGPSCLFHWLKVSVPGEAPKKLCGDKSPGIIHTGSHVVDLEFHTDRHGQSGGFSLRYTTQRVECKIEGGMRNGRITPNFPKYSYRDYIQVRCNTGYKLMMGENEIKSYKSMCQENGRWHLPLPECRIIDCGEPKSLLNGGYQFLSGSNNEYRSVVQYHCNKPFYSFAKANEVNLTCAADRKWRGLENVITPYCFPVCGRPVVDLSSRGRVFGGDIAKNNSFPWQVFLHAGGRGGAIVIGEKWLLTAAHNLEKVKHSKDEVKAYVGSNRVSDYFGSSTKADPVLFQSLPIESLHIHPQYKSPDFNNDIALIKLASSITFNARVMPVCLPEQDSKLENFGWVSGFGLTETYNTANHLRYIRLPIVDQQVCHSSIEKAREVHSDISTLTENMFCAGLPEGGKDTCQGDSGSGFVMKNNDVFYAAGIVSWGVDCGTPGRYGVYTRIARYANWINKTMEEN